MYIVFIALPPNTFSEVVIISFQRRTCCCLLGAATVNEYFLRWSLMPFSRNKSQKIKKERTERDEGREERERDDDGKS